MTGITSRPAGFAAALILAAGLWTEAAKPLTVPKWERFEQTFLSTVTYANPPQEASLWVSFSSPLGERLRVPGFWDGGKTWRVRFAPHTPGKWTWQSECSDARNQGLHARSGEFFCIAPTGRTLFTRHGPVRVSGDGRSLIHDDLTPFFWLADTAWNGPLLSTPDEWALYLRERARQKFSAIQWVTTQWRAAPEGDREKRPAYRGKEKIEINPAFFQRLDQKVVAMNRAGFLSVPVLLWAITGGSNPAINPGVSLPEDQAILLARYMVARWQGDAVVWILNGDGDYRGEKAARWRRIGQAVFGDIAHAPVTCHPGGNHWVLNEFINEKWYDLCGYQSGHNDRDDNLRWITQGPAAKDWHREPFRPFLSLEAPYENHAGGAQGAMSADIVRRAHYWSLLNAPTAGVTYGGHGIWGWDDGSGPPVDHPRSGTPLPWQKALLMPGAEQMRHLGDLFRSLDFWRLQPAPEILANQPGAADPKRFISAARTKNKDLAVIYIPSDRVVEVQLEALTTMPGSPNITWFNPRTGEKRPAVALVGNTTCQMPTPEPGDWVLLITAAPK